jgi:hypothetical protein
MLLDLPPSRPNALSAAEANDFGIRFSSLSAFQSSKSV